MNGLFAKLAIVELRAESGTCSGSCSSYACFKVDLPMVKGWLARAVLWARIQLTSVTIAIVCSV